MKAVGGPQKLRFTVQSCSGEDPDYPARELLYHSPTTRGWQSPRFCKYPQDIVLRLEQPSKVTQIQILSHEFKIPTRIEVFVGGADPPGAAPQVPGAGGLTPGALELKRLGYLSFDPNERSAHQARELKSVHVNVSAAFVRLSVARCHVNKLNIYNQVGIVALNLIGEPLALPEGPPGYLEVIRAPPMGVSGPGAAAVEQPYYNRAAGELADLNLDLHVDAVTAGRIRELARAKEAAVGAEDYDEAKRLKGCIERLKMVGGKIAQLEARKRAAVEREDYDMAKALKADIDKLRAGGEAAAANGGGLIAAHAGGGGAANGGGAAATGARGDEVVARMLSRAAEGGGAAAADTTALGDAGARMRTTSDASSGGGGGGEPAAPPPVPLPVPVPVAARAAPAGVRTHTAYDERPAVARGSYADMDESALIAADPSTVSAAMFMQAAPLGVAAATGAEPPPGWPADLPPPEPLAGAHAKDAEALAELAGDYVAAAAFSRSWQLRDAALTHALQLVRGGSGEQLRDAARTCGRLAVRALRDTVPSVVTSALALFKAALEGLGPGRDAAGVVEAALTPLMDKVGDANPRISGGARDALLALASARDVSLRALAGQLVRAPARAGAASAAAGGSGGGASAVAARPLLAQLRLLQDVVPLVGVARGGSGGGGSNGGGEGGFDLGELMDFVGRALGSASADVRAAAVKVAVAAYAQAGPPVRRLLPRDLNPKVREQLEVAIGVDPGAAGTQAAAATPPAKPRAAPAPSSAPRSTGRSAAAAARAGAAAPPAAHTRARGQATQAPRAQPPQQRQQQRQQQPVPAAPALPPAEDATALPPGEEDPESVEAVLLAREAAHGPQHVSVAEAASSLAILYNQRGDYARARPLFERALAVYEAAYGSDHQEVAHTLTDLAVLHMEQGDDEVGRPLLERALAIQEALLGPDHPDVVAIRDVLTSD